MLARKFPGFGSADFDLRRMDSLQLVELVNEIEREFGIEIHSMEIDEQNFRDLSSMEALVERKLK